jgi:NAD(P)-dependent dehydrogenase (short-subunit alcohol dehydrogenase family)
MPTGAIKKVNFAMYQPFQTPSIIMEERVYLITGGTSGIGLAIVKRLSDSGARVVSFSRSDKKIIRARDSYPWPGEVVDFLRGDVTRHDDIDTLFDHISERYGRLHGLVNNAAILNKGTLESTSPEDWDRVMQANLTAPFLITKRMLPLLKMGEGAAIVNISSVAALKPGTSLAYSVSKAGIDMFTKYLAGELGKYGVRVNSVNPGLVLTNLHYDNRIVANESQYQKMLDKAIRRYPLGKLGQPEDIAEMVAFLLSEKAGWITGSVITADGGVMVENNLAPSRPEPGS